MASRLRAACLTPTGSGGVAIVRLAGHGALAELAPFLRRRRDDRPASLSSDYPDKLVLARLFDAEELIDECLACCRATTAGEVIDLNLHGGPRVVERTLLLLQRLGAEVVDGLDLLDPTSGGAPSIQTAILQALPLAKTPEVVRWLLGLSARLGRRIEGIVDLLRGDHLAEARDALAALCTDTRRVRFLLEGVRLVLTGPPNAGKSTLANALSGQQMALVSDQPGTTRDWTEHHTRFGGVPVVIVDTAGVRGPADAIEREAITRGRHQAAESDIVLVVLDASTRQPAAFVASLQAHPLRLVVWNKSDLAQPPQEAFTPGEQPLPISAAAPAGLDALQAAVLKLIGLHDPQHWPAAPLSQGHLDRCREALALLSRTPGDAAAAARLLAVFC